MIESLTLTNTGPAPTMEVRWAPRLNLITGDNGLGKTFLLDIAWWVLTRTWASHAAQPTGAKKATIAYVVRGSGGKSISGTSEYRKESSSWPLPSGRPPKQGIVIYVRVDGGFSVWDPARNYWRTDEARPDAYHFSSNQVWEGLDMGGRRACEGLERDWVTWQRSNAPQFEVLCAALEKLSAPGETIKPGIPRRIFVGEGRERPTIEFAGQTVPIVFASSGIRRILALAYLAVWAWSEHEAAAKILGKKPERNMTILFDEPETHLHPRWQRKLLRSLLEVPSVLMGGDSCVPQVLVATHSPLILASAEPLFSKDKDDLVHLMLDGERVILEQGRWLRQGDVSNWLVSDVFALEQARSIEAEEAIEQAEQFMRGDGGDRHLIHTRLKELLEDHDPFWPRWIIKLEGNN